MIENPSWQQHNRNNNVPILSNGEFNLFLRSYLNNSDFQMQHVIKSKNNW
jgi:hypothetical protein